MKMVAVVAVVACLAACGKSKDNTAVGSSSGSAPGGGAPAGGGGGNAPAAPAGMPAAPASSDGSAAIAGSVEIAGALTGTFAHGPNDSITCGSVPDVGTFGFSVTMSDGKDTYISLDGVASKERTELSLHSVKLGDTKPTTTGFTLTGDGKHVWASIDASISVADGKTAAVKAKLTFTCP